MSQVSDSNKVINILADENMLGLEASFACEGAPRFELKTMPGRDIQPDDVVGCDVLLVRSVTQVDQELISESKLRFVGSATAGLDHVDLAYLKEKGVPFANAKGANALAVAEYVITCLAFLSQQKKQNFFKKQIAIVGYGHVGKALASKLRVLGGEPIIYDPFLAEQEVAGQKVAEQGLVEPRAEEVAFSSWQDVLDADVVSLHVPLTDSGAYPTKYMISKEFFEKFSKDGALINAARGGVVDEQALLSALESSQLSCVLDVWEGEPQISGDVCALVEVASPHVAGYSLEAKLRATEMLKDRLLERLNIKNLIKTNTCSGNLKWLSEEKVPASIDTWEDFYGLLLALYSPQVDTDSLRSIQRSCSSDRTKAKAFDAQRKGYAHRAEWSSYACNGAYASTSLGFDLADLGFQVGDKLEKSKENQSDS